MVAQREMNFNVWPDNLAHSNKTAGVLCGVCSISSTKNFIPIKVLLWKTVSENELGKKGC